MVKNFFLISDLNLPSVSLEPFPLVLSDIPASTTQSRSTSKRHRITESCFNLWSYEGVKLEEIQMTAQENEVWLSTGDLPRV